MKQFSFQVNNSSELEPQLTKVRQYLDLNKASAVLTHIYSGHTDRARLELVVQAIHEYLPESMVVGTTAGGEIYDGALAPCSIVVVIDIFETTTIIVSNYTIAPGEEEKYGSLIQNGIDETPHVKAAELLVDCSEISSAVMFPAINKCSSHVQIFGSVPYAHDLKKPMFIFTGNTFENVTAILVTYSGDDFFISTDYVIGWKPMGVGMHVTKASGSVLNELDYEGALEVYDKYLKIPNDEHFYENAFEFPFLRYYKDIYMMRLPYAGLSDGSIELRAPVREGDVMYLSYGDKPTILGEVYETRSRMERFYPQYIRLHNCATRKTFWGPEIDKEIGPFHEVAPANGFLTGGEILRVNDFLVHFNATLVVVGMREGMPDENSLLRMQERRREDASTQQTSMVRRMANFINVAMQELLESNRQLDELAKTDGLTDLLNRREMNRVIKEHHNEGTPFCLLMADLDDFKHINDTCGHDVGDRVLSDVANLIRDCIEVVHGAAASRWGGEEFMILLPDTTAYLAQDMAERLRANIEAHDFNLDERLTISLGVADSATYCDMASIYHDVDQALYAAKQAGKNVVFTAGSKK